jgi:hydrogenase maturation protease
MLPQDQMARILIIGWGNPLRGDDGVGWRAAELLAGALEGRDAKALVSHQLMPEFAEEISRSELVIFIDAACDNGVGELRLERIEPDRAPSAAFSHELSPPALLGMAEKLYGSRPEAHFVSVGGGSFEYGEELSPEVQSALPALLREVERVCGELPGAAIRS